MKTGSDAAEETQLRAFRGEEIATMTNQEARDLGTASGIEDVENVLAEQGIEVIRATLAPGHLGWDEAAINAAAHTFDGVPEEHRAAYYEAYASAARQHAEELLAAEPPAAD